MDMPQPKLVINLLSSFGGATHKTCNQTNDIHFCAPKQSSSVLSHHTHSELNAKDFMDSNSKIKAFLEECVLPVAIKTEALVLVHTNVSFGSY